jgi:hypothetical protein
MREGCAACGARAVGPPLARPERELPGFGRALFIAAGGALVAAAFIVALAAALLARESFARDFAALLHATEAAAWRLKWTVLPAGLLLSALCARLYARMRRAPERFAGHKLARAGLAMSVVVAVALSALVVASVPERLRRREEARRAAENALLYAGDRALARYRERFGTYPAALADLRRLEDPDGSIKALLAVLDAGEYRPETNLASLAAGRSKKGGRRRASRVRAAARNTDDLPGAGLALTNYELVLPGRDRVLGTPDDLRIRDGVLGAAAPPPVASPTLTPAAAATRRAY